MQRKGQPVMILTCQHDSHRFEDRTIVVNEVIKVGRAVARSKAAPNNAIFDCKVLSRNHAIIWFSSDEFWLRDTNSSNGTFVNNTRVSKRDDSESSDRQIFSGDVIRFGVDVVEHDTTHGCIVASVTLFLPNGQEARPKLGHTGDVLPSGLISISNEQMFQISYFLSDTVFREQALDKKLETLRQALQQATVASELGWQAMLSEEKLLQKLDLYEAQMRLFKEDLSEGSLKMKLSELLEEKSLQEAESKNQLTKLLKDKEVALQRVRDLERTLEDLKEECAYLQGEYTSAQDACSNISDEYKTNLTTISQRVNELTTERNQLHEQLVQANQENTALKEHCEQISHELDVTKEMYEQAKLKATGFANGLPDTEDSNKGLSSVLASKEVDGEINSCKDIDAELVQNQPVEPTCNEEVLVESSKSEANEYISDSIRDFHQALELIRILDAKISALAPTTDLDFATSEEVRPEEPSGVTTCSANPSAIVDASSLSSSSIEPLVKRIVRHNEAAMTSLHAYLRQVNPLAATELINKIYLSNFDAQAPAGVAENDVGNQPFPRPSFLTLHNVVDKSVEAVGSSGRDEGVLVAGADSLNASPTVSSGNGTLSFALSPDAEEVAHLRECVRLANKEIEHYKAHIAELQMTAASENKATSGDSDALEEMRVECCVLRARIGDIEDQMEQTRENHRRLVEETRQHRTEVENLRTQRAELEAALAEAQANIAALESKDRQQHPSTAFNHLTPSTSCLADSSAHSDRIELAPGRLVTASSLTVIPLMLLVFAAMLAIFSKFVS